MDDFSNAYLAGIATKITEITLKSIGRKLRTSICGTEKEQAINRCFQLALLNMLASSHIEDEQKRSHIKDILTRFFDEEDTSKELSCLIRGMPINIDELLFLFNDCGYDASTLPEFDFKKALDAFEKSFIAAALNETTLHGTIQTQQLLSQTHIQKDMLHMLQQILQTLGKNLETIGISQGKIVIYNDHREIVNTFSTPFGHDQIILGDWQQHYLRTLVEKCDPLDLTPLDEKLSPEQSTIHISDIFTSLYISKFSDISSKKQNLLLNTSDFLKIRDIHKKKPIQAVDFISVCKRLVVLGQPGCGKSTLINHVATQLACTRLGNSNKISQLPGWDKKQSPVPVVIILRLFAERLPEKMPDNKAGLVWDYIEEQVQECGCKEAFPSLKKELLKNGIVFFDGLDEVNEKDEGKRTLIKSAILEFSKPLENCQIVITCREYAYKQNDPWRFPESEFMVAELDLFKKDQIEYFIKKWYSTTGKTKGWEDKKIKNEAKSLFVAINESDYLHDLAQYPLLLTLMAIVHGRDGYLPQDRASLYERAINLLLASWENRIVRHTLSGYKIEPSLILQLGVRTELLRSTLERVAFSAHKIQQVKQSHDAANIPKAELRDELADGLGSFDKAEKVISYIRERTGLLSAVDNHTYRFPHRTFQEYLAATYIMRQSDYDTLLYELIDRDINWWREVFLLAAGSSKKTPRILSDLVYGMIPPQHDVSTLSVQEGEKILLVAQALVETKFGEEVYKEAKNKQKGRFYDTHDRIINWLLIMIKSTQSIEPEEREKAGILLSNLGDPRKGVISTTDMTFCYIPKGLFQMGSESQKHLNKCVDYDYWISVYPVTNGQFNEFIDANGYDNNDFWPEAIEAGIWEDGKIRETKDSKPRNKPKDYGIPFNLCNHPVVGITWYEALAFTRWLAKKWWDEKSLPSDFKLKLPSEAEWEKAARGGLEIPESPIKSTVQKLFKENDHLDLIKNPKPARRYPWLTDKPDPNLANYSDSKINSTNAVGCFPNGSSPYGCEEMSGNVWEWTRSLWGKDLLNPDFSYPYAPDDDRELLTASRDIRRVVRGGSFFSSDNYVGCSFRDWDYPCNSYKYYGFRVILSPL